MRLPVQFDTGADAGRKVDPGGTARFRVRFLAALSLAAVLSWSSPRSRPCPAGSVPLHPTPMLSALTVNDGTNDLTLDPIFAPGTYVYAAEVGNAVTTVTLTATVNDDGAEVSGVTLGGTAIADSDFTDGITVPSLIAGDNEIVVTVTGGGRLHHPDLHGDGDARGGHHPGGDHLRGQDERGVEGRRHHLHGDAHRLDDRRPARHGCTDADQGFPGGGGPHEDGDD